MFWPARKSPKFFDRFADASPLPQFVVHVVRTWATQRISRSYEIGHDAFAQSYGGKHRNAQVVTVTLNRMCYAPLWVLPRLAVRRVRTLAQRTRLHVLVQLALSFMVHLFICAL